MATSWTAPAGISLDKKTLKVTTYSGAVDLTSDTFKDSGANAVDASNATNKIEITTGEKATTVTTGSKGAIINSNKAADKVSLGSGADEVNFAVGKSGNDVISGYETGDKIVIDGVDSEQVTFTDKDKTVTVTFNGSKEKLTINKTNTSDAINFEFDDGTYAYGALPSGSSFDSKKTTLTVGASASGTVELKKIASTVKNVGVASGNSAKLNIVGNSQANAISLGAGGGTVDGGYSYDAAKGSAPKATSDKLYGSNAADVFVFNQSLGGADQVFGYDNSQGDQIYVSDMKQSEIAAALANAKNLKDSGKNIVATFNKSKLTVDGTPKQVVFRGNDNKYVVYGPSLPDGTYVDSKKTTLFITSDTAVSRTPYVYSVGDSDFNSTYYGAGSNDTIYVNSNYAPKLKTLDASTYNGTVILGSAEASLSTELKASKGGSTLYGGKNADVFTGSEGANDVFVYTLDSLGGGAGKDKITGFESMAEGKGDYIMLDGYDESLHSLTLTEKTGKSLTIAINNKKTNKVIGQLEISENPTNKTILVVDGNKKIIATNPPTAPQGLIYDAKTGIKTDTNYTGSYTLGSYLVGDNLASGVQDHTGASATIKAADYNSKLAVINASTVASSVTELLIEGNETAKNVITAPNYENLLNSRTSSTTLSTTLKSGLSQDELNGSTLNGSKDSFFVTPQSKAQKVNVNNYDENDLIIIQATQNINNASAVEKSLNDKGADAILTLDKTTVTIKDGAGKQLNVALYDSVTGALSNYATIGHFLPKGLKYDTKKVTISVKDGSQSEAYDVGGDSAALELDYDGDEVYSGNEGYVALDLTSDKYFNTVKTINLKKIDDTDPEPGKTKIADNSVHVTLLGNTLANDFWSGGNSSSTAIMYGGAGISGKPESDKFYGADKVKDIFVYALGDGKDQIGDTKNGGTYKSNDYIILGSADPDKILTRDDVYVTDKGNTVTIQIGTDTKKGTLTVLKDKTETPLQLVFTKDSTTALSLASSIASGLVTDGSGDDYVFFKYGLKSDTLSSALSGTKLTIGDFTGTLPAGESFPLVVDVNAKDISSTIKDIGVASAANTEVSLNIVGNNNANNITLGAGGGTVDGGYSLDTKGKYKATADKYYGGSGNDVFVYNKLGSNVLTDLGGKDVIYNYEPGKDAILVDNISDIASLKYSAKSIVFTFKGGKNASSKGNVLTIQGLAGTNTINPDTQITFIDNAGNVRTFTYFDAKNTTSIGDLTEVLNPWNAYKNYLNDETNEPWTTSDAKDNLRIWTYTGNSWTNNGLSFTVSNIDAAYSTYYNSTTGKSAMDVQEGLDGIRPIGISVEEPHGNIIEVAQIAQDKGGVKNTVSAVNFSDFHFNSDTTVGKDGVHILGLAPTYTGVGAFNDNDVAYVGEKSNANLYRLADLDGDASNGYELLKLNDKWALMQNGNWQYEGNNSVFTIKAGSEPLEVSADGRPASVLFTADEEGNPTIDDGSITIGSAIDSSRLKFSSTNTFGKNGLHLYGYEVGTKFAVDFATTVGKTSTVVAKDYVLAELDGDSDNGLEFLKTNSMWTLGSEGWSFSSGTTAFNIALTAPTLQAYTAADETDQTHVEGTPVNIAFGFKQSLNSSGAPVADKYDPSKGLKIDFTGAGSDADENESAPVNNALVSFSKAGTNTNGVHIAGLNNAPYTIETEDETADEDAETSYYNPQVKVGGTDHWLVELDGETVDGGEYSEYRELAKSNANWAPIYNEFESEDKTYTTNEYAASQTGWQYSSDDVSFTLNGATYYLAGTNKDAAGKTVILGVDDNGALKDVKVSGNTITFDSTTVASLATFFDGADNASQKHEVLYLDDFLTLSSNTAVGRSGIHIKGYASDTTLTINYAYPDDENPDATNEISTTYQLVDLDNNASNGYELMKVDYEDGEASSGWTYEKKAWSYTKKVEESSLIFTIGSEAGIAPLDNGTPNGVSVSFADVYAEDDEEGAEPESTTTTLTVNKSVRDKFISSVKFAAKGLPTGWNSIHVVGLDDDTKLKGTDGSTDSKSNLVYSDMYQVVELDGDTTNGSEIMTIDPQWTLKSGAWSYSNASGTAKATFAFSIAAAASISASGGDDNKPEELKGEGAEGTPLTITYDSNSTTLDLSDADNFRAANLTFSTIAASMVGAGGLHFILPTETDTNTIALDSKFTINNVAYQLVDLDHKTDADADADGDADASSDVDYELMKVDSKWKLSNGAWTYSDTNLVFTISSDAGIYANNDGTPSGVTVAGTTINLTNCKKGSDDSTAFDPSWLTISKATPGTTTTSIRIVGLDDKADTEFKIGTSTQVYQLADINATAGLELMAKDANWTYTTDKTDIKKSTWRYAETKVQTVTGDDGEVQTETVTTFAFTIKNAGSGTALAPTANGTPTGTSVTGNSTTGKILTLPSNAKEFVTNGNLELETFDVGTKGLHISASGLAEGSQISVGESDKDTYTLMDADGSTVNGYELTYDGWLKTSLQVGRSASATVESYRYKNSTKKLEFQLSGSAFGGTTTTNDYGEIFYTYAENANKPEGVSVDSSASVAVISFSDITDTTREAFHITGSSVSANSKVTVNDVEFTLKNVDGNDYNGFELTNDNWSKVSDSAFAYGSGTYVFTLSGGADADTNNIPDGVSFGVSTVSGSKPTFTFDNSEATGVVTLTGSSNGWASNFDVVVTDAAENTTYKLKQDSDNKKVYTIEATTTAPAEENPQLPATGFDTTGFEVDDLINYDSAAAFDSGLDEIMEIKALAATDSFNVGSMFDAQSDLVSAAASTYSARNKLKK